MIVYREIKSVECDLGFSAKTLFALSNNLSDHYKTFLLPKRDGGVRTLYIPDYALKKVQRAIAEKILSHVPVSKYATAYKYGASVQKNARVHVGSKKLLKLDILHFFDSIYYTAVKEKVFPRERFAESIRVLLTMLCYHKDLLPQGAPTSPVITNILMREFDEIVGNWCDERNITYTRYCDDMTFSGDFDEMVLEQFVRCELLKNGFLLNRKKRVLACRGKRQTVTGLVVNDKLNVTSEYRKKIRQEIYFCQKFGLTEHLQRIGEEDEKRYLSSLLGRISFVLQTRRDDKEFNNYKSFVKELLKTNKTT